MSDETREWYDGIREHIIEKVEQGESPW